MDGNCFHTNNHHPYQPTCTNLIVCAMEQDLEKRNLSNCCNCSKEEKSRKVGAQRSKKHVKQSVVAKCRLTN